MLDWRDLGTIWLPEPLELALLTWLRPLEDYDIAGQFVFFKAMWTSGRPMKIDTYRSVIVDARDKDSFAERVLVVHELSGVDIEPDNLDHGPAGWGSVDVRDLARVASEVDKPTSSQIRAWCGETIYLSTADFEGHVVLLIVFLTGVGVEGHGGLE